MAEHRIQNVYNYLLIIFLIVSCHAASAEDGAVAGYNREERETLYALKKAFNHPLLNKNWNGLPCYMNNPNTTWYGISCVDGRIVGLSLEGLGLIGQVIADTLVNLTQLTTLSFKNNSISGGLMDFSMNKKLVLVDLSSNMFDGSISPLMVGLDLLESLQLQENNLTGPIPGFNQTNLREFNVSNNHLSGELPKTVVLQSFDEWSYYNNPELCGPPCRTPCKTSAARRSLKDQSSDSSGGDKGSNLFDNHLIIYILVGGAVAALAMLVYVFFVHCNRPKPVEQEEKGHFEAEMKGRERNVETREEKVVPKEERSLSFVGEVGGFELGDLLKASAEGLGKGNFGSTYKATLDDRPSVVVKRLKDLNPLSAEEFAKQLTVLAELKHPNVLPLLAYYYSKDEKLLVYKCAENGNLFNRIHGGRGRGRTRVPFKWSSRLAVARDVARAMTFLHRNTESRTIIPHGNLKSSNVLLVENDMAMVADYGFISLIATPIAVQRMVAYKSPEYEYCKRILWKSDVWCFGSLLLELLTGKISNLSAPQGVNGVDLCNWVHRAVREEWTAEIFDLEIAVQRNAIDGMLKLLKIAIRCCDKSAEKRPEMAEVLRDIETMKTFRIDEDDGPSSEGSIDISISSNSPMTSR